MADFDLHNDPDAFVSRRVELEQLRVGYGPNYHCGAIAGE